MELQSTVSSAAGGVPSTAWELFRRCIELQQRQDWQVFVERHRERVAQTVHWALRRLGDWQRTEDPEEITQELYCRLLSGVARGFRGRTEGELWTYLGQVIFHLLLDLRRRQSAAKRRPPRAQAQVGPERVPSQQSSPEEATLLAEQRRLFFETCSGALRGPRSGAKLRALWLAIFGGWSSQEAARAVGGSPSAPQIDNMICRLKPRLAAEGMRLPRRSPA